MSEGVYMEGGKVSNQISSANKLKRMRRELLFYSNRVPTSKFNYYRPTYNLYANSRD